MLAQNFVADAPNRVWLTDITYIPTDEGWLYLAGHKDICPSEIVGYAMSNRMTKNLVSQSLRWQEKNRYPVIFFSCIFNAISLPDNAGCN